VCGSAISTTGMGTQTLIQKMGMLEFLVGKSDEELSERSKQGALRQCGFGRGRASCANGSIGKRVQYRSWGAVDKEFC